MDWEHLSANLQSHVNLCIARYTPVGAAGIEGCSRDAAINSFYYRRWCIRVGRTAVEEHDRLVRGCTDDMRCSWCDGLVDDECVEEDVPAEWVLERPGWDSLVSCDGAIFVFELANGEAAVDLLILLVLC
jgi:hypothetical protein